jgi:hypothetical protein
MDHRHLRVPATSALVLAMAGLLGGCVATSASRVPVVMASPMAPEQLAACVAHVFDSQIPLVHRRSWSGGAELVVRDLRDRPMVVVSIAAAPGGSTLRFLAEGPDRHTYLRLIGNCVRLG